MIFSSFLFIVSTAHFLHTFSDHHLEMVGKFIFSFSSSVDLSLDQAIFFRNPVIHFGFGFDLFKVTTLSIALTTIPASEVPTGS